MNKPALYSTLFSAFRLKECFNRISNFGLQMGLFRMILAIAVVLSHIPEVLGDSVISRDTLGIKIWSGHAVFAFFIISGFYISLVINEKYSKLIGGNRKFYLNRALRLYPTHWVILILYAVMFALINAPSFLLGETYGQPGLFAIAWFSNLTFIGVEWIPFFNVENWKFMIGPVWSLGVEISFYILAPFVVTRSLRTLIVLTLLFLGFRLGLYFSEIAMLPWRYFFFPANFVFFLMGSLAYRIYAARDFIPCHRQLGYLAAAALAFCTVYDPLWTAPDLDQWQSWLFFIVVWICTPFLFALTKNSVIDNWIGQLTYPVYIGHMLVIAAVPLIYTGPMDKGLLALLGTFALATALFLLVDRPIEHFRRRVGAVARSAPTAE